MQPCELDMIIFHAEDDVSDLHLSHKWSPVSIFNEGKVDSVCVKSCV